jgi:hypothetical protein
VGVSSMKKSGADAGMREIPRDLDYTLVVEPLQVVGLN